MWCPQCGAEYKEGVTTCTDCGVALSAERPATPEGDAVEGGEVVVYELADWTADQRGTLEQRLQAEGIEHAWENTEGREVGEGYEAPHAWEDASDLVVGERDEEAVDAILDEIENPHALDPVSEDEAEEGSDEADYEAMSHLYVAADRLKDDPGDLALAGEFFDAADAARAVRLPFGFDPDVWTRVKELADSITASLEQEAGDDLVRASAQELRDILFEFV